MAFPFDPIKRPAPALSQKSLVAMIKNKLANLTDVRTGKNSQYEVSDAALSAFAVFFLQNPSFLAQQINLQKAQGKNNLHTLFGAYSNPCDNQIRRLLDEVSPSELHAIFSRIFNDLHETGYFKPFTVLDGSLLIALDGVEYFSSEKIHCDCCSTQEFTNGKIHYSHKAITPVIVSPQQSNVIPLAPEFVTPQDGHTKQDSELAAAQRWLLREGQGLSAHNVTILGDDLYSHQPYCAAIKTQNMHFILVCKQDSHATLYEWLADFERTGKVSTVTRSHWDGKHRMVDTYRFMNELPLRNSDDAMLVNWCELKSVRDDGKVLYYNSFVTDYQVSENNVLEMVAAGRSRWKIENENNNTLKTKGYHFEHNFGHGKKNLSSVLATLILLAFLFHTVLEHFDKCYQLLRSVLSSREMFFEDVRALTRYICFESWQQMLEFMLKGLEIPIPESV
jgi:hypothetical protein